MTPTARPCLVLLLLLGACAAEPTKKKSHHLPPRPAPPVEGTSAPLATPVAEAEPAPEGAPADGTPAPRAGGEPGSSAPTGAVVAGGASGAPAARALPAAEGDPVLVTVDGSPIGARELLRLWMHRESRTVYEYVQTLVERRIVASEARRAGIAVDEALVERSVAERKADMQARVAELDPDLSFEDYVRTRRGLDPERYLEVVRQNQMHALALERVVRAWQLAQERAEIRLVIVLEDDPVDDVQAALDAGRPFAEVAAEFSRDPSREDGGLMPPVVRAEDLLLSRLAFSTPKGGVTGPVEDDGRVLWVYVEDFPEPLRGLWAEVEPAVEASLAERPIDEIELIQWRQAVYPYHEIDNRPFMDLVGEPYTER